MLTETFKIVATAALTIIGGLVVFIVSGIAQRLVFETVDQLRKLRGEIAHSLSYYANIIGNITPENRSSPEVLKATETYRQQGSEIRRVIQYCPVPILKAAAQFRAIPSADCWMDASAELIGMSNAPARSKEPHERRDKTEKLLEFKTSKHFK